MWANSQTRFPTAITMRDQAGSHAPPVTTLVSVPGAISFGRICSCDSSRACRTPSSGCTAGRTGAAARRRSPARTIRPQRHLLLGALGARSRHGSWRASDDAALLQAVPQPREAVGFSHSLDSPSAHRVVPREAIAKWHRFDRRRSDFLETAVPRERALAGWAEQHDLVGLGLRAVDLHAGRADRHPRDSEPPRLRRCGQQPLDGRPGT